MINLPRITHLQFLVLTTLLNGTQSGEQIRNKILMNGPAFYQLMARLEDNEYIIGRYIKKIIDGQHIKEREYSITTKGIKSREKVLNFYKQYMGKS